MVVVSNFLTARTILFELNFDMLKSNEHDYVLSRIDEEILKEQEKGGFVNRRKKELEDRKEILQVKLSEYFAERIAFSTYVEAIIDSVDKVKKAGNIGTFDELKKEL